LLVPGQGPLHGGAGGATPVAGGLVGGLDLAADAGRHRCPAKAS
jgi:hypothetical protein